MVNFCLHAVLRFSLLRERRRCLILQVFVGGLFCPIISSSFAPEAVHGVRRKMQQLPACMIKVQTRLKPDATGKAGSSITYGVRLADVSQPADSLQELVCNGVMHTIGPGVTVEVRTGPHGKCQGSLQPEHFQGNAASVKGSCSFPKAGSPSICRWSLSLPRGS